MPEDLCLADSSIWILAFRSKKKERWIEEFQSLLLNRQIATAPPVKLEILSGARTPQEFKELSQEFDALKMLETTGAVWQEAAGLGFSLRQKGLSAPAVDLLIAATALFYRCTLFHYDRHFAFIEKHAPLKTKTLRGAVLKK